MSDMLQELKEIIALNEQEQFISFEIALNHLHERFGDNLISELMECLTDDDPEVRKLAVELLIEARPESLPAIPDLIERLRSDDDRLVQVAVLVGIAEFGELAFLALDDLHPWLDDDDEYIRILAATAIMTIDEYRTEQLPAIRSALKSDNPMVRQVAREFFARTKTTMPFDEIAFQEVVRANWLYHSPCEHLYWKSELQEDDSYRIDVAPVYQEIFAGPDDAKKVWAGFDFHLNGFAQEPGVEFSDFGAASRCLDHEPIPFVGIKGHYFGVTFVLRIGLEPLPDSAIREVLDTIRNEARPIESAADDFETPE